MRQLWIQLPRGEGRKVLDLAKAYDGVNGTCVEAANQTDFLDLVVVYLPNGQIEPFIGAVQQEIPGVRLNFFPQGVFSLYPPPDDAPSQVMNVQPRSSLEVFLSGLQSVGSWTSFAIYALVSGIVSWLGLITDTLYLLVAAMLIAPYGSPAMNSAIAMARGDWPLLGRNLVRYGVSLFLSVVSAALLTLVFGQTDVTPLMASISEVSVLAFVLPLVAGVAGALHLTQSERNSLVSAAGSGILIAASLAPQAALIGMSTVMQEWDMLKNGAFLLLLQLLGIQLAGSLVFRGYAELRPQGVRYPRGRESMFRVTLGAAVLLLAALLIWQNLNPPSLQRATIAYEAAGDIREVLNGYDHWVRVVEVSTRFTREEVSDQNTMLGVVYVQRNPQTTAASQVIRAELTRAVQTALLQKGYGITPVIDISVLDPPAGD